MHIKVTSETQTWYPGIGADAAMRELNELVGQITATWAQVEDLTFELFVVALTGFRRVPNVYPFRAAFFSHSGFESKLRMVDGALKARFTSDKDALSGWNTLQSSLKGFSQLRNKIAHLAPTAKSSLDPSASANVRLVPPYWKSLPDNNPDDFDKLGFSANELWQALGPYWGYHPRIGLPRVGDEGFAMAFRVQQFAISLSAKSGET